MPKTMIKALRGGMMPANPIRTALWIVAPITLCVSSAAAQQSNAAGPQGPAALAPPTTNVVRGYVHDISRSRFNIGQNVELELNAPALRRWRGSQGAWAIDPSNNWSMGLLDAGAPTGPYILDEAVHGERVKAYFIAAGIPAEQVRDVRATFEGFSGGPTSEGAMPAPVQLHSINSILTRSVQGIPVIESVAWAKMTTAGGVDMECVFWPAIDAQVANRAVAFAKQMSDSAAHAAYLAKLPGQVYRDGGVVIHHTDPSVHATPTAYVSYDVTLAPQGHAAMRHFDEGGMEFRLPQEEAVSTQPTAEPQPE
jgi:hypothetical protein